jgi:WD40 repeat protein
MVAHIVNIAMVMVRMTFGPNHVIEFSPSGTLLAAASSDATARLWDVASGAHLATLVPLPSGGYITLLPDARYKLHGDPGDCLWWAAGHRREQSRCVRHGSLIRQVALDW